MIHNLSSQKGRNKYADNISKKPTKVNANPNYIVDTLKIAHITSNSLLHEVEMAMKGREAFIDNTPIEEKIYTADIFEAIMCEGKVSAKAMSQLEVLAEQTEYVNYIQII